MTMFLQQECLYVQNLLVVGNSNIFFGIFTPNIGEDEPILTNMFQMGWFNHHENQEIHVGIDSIYQSHGMVWVSFNRSVTVGRQAQKTEDLCQLQSSIERAAG